MSEYYEQWKKEVGTGWRACYDSVYKDWLEAELTQANERNKEAIDYFDSQGKNRTVTWEDATNKLKELLKGDK